jgi:hypothetical protein
MLIPGLVYLESVILPAAMQLAPLSDFPRQSSAYHYRVNDERA